MDIFKPDVESIYMSCIDSSSCKFVPTQICPAKPEAESITCTTASVQLDSIQTPKFRLLSLPIEIRRTIFRFYLHSPHEGWGSRYRLLHDSKYCNIFCLKKWHTQLLLVNHQVHDEAIDLLYEDTVWHFSFNSFVSKIADETVHDTFLREFRARPEFRLIRHVTIGVMFLNVMKEPFRTLENSNRLRINRKLLRKICKMLREAPNLQTVKLLWHDRIDCGDWEKKRTCLSSVAKLPEGVRCQIFLGPEANAVHSHKNSISSRLGLSIQEEAAKAKLNDYLKAVRREHQASSHHKSPDGLEKTSTQNTLKQSSV